jgi:NAD(P)H dehydrogenase (quinone)
MNTSVAVVYHSGYGHTTRVASAIVDGLRQGDNVDATSIVIDAEGNIPDAAWLTLGKADAIVFGSPTYMGSVSWQFKKFADATSKAWFTQDWKDKLFAGFTNSASMNGDKHSTLHYFVTLAMQHGGAWIGTGVQASNKKSAQRDDINYLGSYAGLMAQSPSDSSADEVPRGDLETAKGFGVRIAQAARARVRDDALTPA